MTQHIHSFSPQDIWQGFHWSFFINVQGLILSLKRFEAYLALGRLTQAHEELATATDLMLASESAMELAGSFSRDQYEQVRKSMTPPQVQADNFSGLMSWEHAALMQIWKRLRPVFDNLPPELKPQHHAFIQAYFSLAQAHRAVCEKFGGGDGGSLRFSQNCAVQTLDKFGHSRWDLIDPKHEMIQHCPFR
jgi:hypothetical protein